MTCEQILRALPLRHGDDLGADERRALDLHLAQCVRCRSILEEEERLDQLLAGRSSTEPSDDLLRRARAGLFAALPAEPRPAAPGDAELRPRPFWRAGRLTPVWAAGLIAFGFLAGWMAFGSGVSAVRTMAGSAVLGTNAEAAQANVNTLVADEESGRVRLSYDMLTRRSLEGTSADPEIRRLLIGTLAESLNAGLRLDAIDALRSGVAEPEVRLALLRSLREDRNVGARLKALDVLEPVAQSDAEVRAALLQAVQSDDNAGVRIRAIDLLAQERDPHALSVFERLSREDPNEYVRMRSAAALDDAVPAASRAR